MNHIRGIEKVATDIRRNEKDPDYRIACIRDYIIAHPDETITLQDFAKAAYGHDNNTGYTGTLVKKLIKQGRITRAIVRDGKKGRHYSYKWHNPRPDGWSKQPEVRVRPMTEEERLSAGLPPTEALSSTLGASETPGVYKSLEDRCDDVLERLEGQDRDTIKELIRRYLKVKGMNSAFMMNVGQPITINVNQSKEEN